MDLLASFWILFCYCGLAAIILLFVILITVFVTTNPYPIVERFKEEETYYDPQTKQKFKFPNIQDPYGVHLSIVVPAYNEEQRLPSMLDEAITFLENRTSECPGYKYEIIVVSDGSTDDTAKIVQSYIQSHGSEKLRCLELIKNRGKGGAVRLGIHSSRGATILFADADGASNFEDIVKLEKALQDVTGYDPLTQPEGASQSLAVVIGSRAHLEKESLAKRNVFRSILMYGFHFLVRIFTVEGIRDTQCGFKLFTRTAADFSFENLHVNRWAFDVELLYIAQKLNIPIVEIPIRWTEIEGSKVTPVISWIQMGCDLALIWLKYTIGAWKLKCDKVE